MVGLANMTLFFKTLKHIACKNTEVIGYPVWMHPQKKSILMVGGHMGVLHDRAPLL